VLRLFCNNKKEQNLSFAEKVLGQKEFLSRQEKEVAFPLAAILARTEDRYFPHLLSMGTGDRGNLAQAYSIAKANIDEDTGKNYLEEFYSGVKGMLETRPDDLGRWAESICSDFRKQGELGLLRGVVG